MTDSTTPQFFACAATLISGKCLFVFPEPLGCVLLDDEQISWWYQRRVIDLPSSEMATEKEFRNRRQLSFPRATVPEPEE